MPPASRLGRSFITHSRRQSIRDEHGQVVPLIALLVVLVGLLALGVARVGVRAITEARAQAAADASALAGASGGRARAEAIAAANGASLVGWAEDGTDVRVDVVVGGAGAAAQARRADPVVASLAPAMRAVLARAAQVVGHPLVVVAVDPGGLSVAIGADDRAGLPNVATQTGLCPSPGRDEWFEVCAAGGPAGGG